MCGALDSGTTAARSCPPADVVLSSAPMQAATRLQTTAPGWQSLTKRGHARCGNGSPDEDALPLGYQEQVRCALCASQPSGRPTATRSRRAAPEGVLVETFCCSLLPCAVKLYPCTADKPTGACSSGKHWTVGWQVTFTQSAAAYRSSLPTTSPQTGERLWPARAVLSSSCHHAQRLSRAHTENVFCVQQ